MAVSRRMIFRSSFLALWAIAMTTITIVLGAPPLRILRLVMGRALFLVMAFGLSLVMFGLGLKPLAILFLFLTILVSFYSEFLEYQLNPIVSAGRAVMLTSLFGVASFCLWAAKSGKDWYARLLETLTNSVGNLPFFQSGFNIGVEDLLLQSPSLLVVLLLLASAILLIMEPRLREWAGLRDKMTSIYLKQFRLPDIFVWLTMASLLGSFIKTDMRWVQVVGTNILNICVVLYFFQGLTVFVALFDRLKMSVFWRTIWTVLLIVQLFVVVAVVGLVDYWMDFRHRFEKRTKQFKKTL